MQKLQALSYLCNIYAGIAGTAQPLWSMGKKASDKETVFALEAVHVCVTIIRHHIWLISVCSIKTILELHFNTLLYYTKQLKDRRQINIGILCDFNILNRLMGKQIK